jgi:hypothetical protein
MYIQFDTASLNQTEARAIIALLSTIYPIGQNSQPAKTEMGAVPVRSEPSHLAIVGAGMALRETVPQPAIVGNASETVSFVQSFDPASPFLVEPATTETTTKRTRRTKEQIAADEAAKADRPPTVGDQLIAAEAARAAAASAAQPTDGAAKATWLRALLNSYISRHTMEEAIERLRAFGCDRVSEALALESVELNKLAATLNG